MFRFVTMSAFMLTSLSSCSETPGEVPQVNNTVDTVVSGGIENTAPAFAGLDPSDFFSNRDYRSSIEAEEPVYLTFQGDTISGEGEGVQISGSTVTITQEGTYVLSGTLANGQVQVNMSDETHKAQLVLDNVTMENATEPVIWVEQADKVFLTMMEGSENTLRSTIDNTESLDATIFSRCDMTLNGEGTLSVFCTNGDALVGKDELTFTSGTYRLTADEHGVDANDSIAIADGTFHIQAGKDGFHCSHSTNESKGNIYILEGDFYLEVAGDGFDASGFLEINGGVFDIETNGGWEAAPVKVAASNHGFAGMGGGTTGGREDMMNQMQGQTGQTGQEVPNDRNQMQGQTGQTGQTGQEVPNDRNQMQGQTGQTQPMDPNQMQGQTGQTQPMDPNQMQGQTGQTQPMDPNQMQGQTGQTLPMDPNQMQGGMMGGMASFLPEGVTLPENFDPRNEEMLQELLSQLDPEFLAQLEAMMGQGPDMSLGGGNYLVDGSEEDVNAVSTKGLKATGHLRIYQGNFSLDCYDDAIHSNSQVEIHGGTFEIGTADDAIHADRDTIITGGDIHIISCFEGIEGQRIHISGGYVDMYCGDDGINAATTNPDPEDSSISLTITGGTIVMDSNSEGDGLDSNGSILITGGDLLISSTTDARDTSLDSALDSIILGGRFVATGSNSGTIQNFDEGSTQGSILVRLSAMVEGQVTLTDSKGNVLVDYLPVKAYQAVAISIPELEVGETYTLTTAGETHEIFLESLQYGTGNTNSFGNRGQR